MVSILSSSWECWPQISQKSPYKYIIQHNPQLALGLSTTLMLYYCWKNWQPSTGIIPGFFIMFYNQGWICETITSGMFLWQIFKSILAPIINAEQASLSRNVWDQWTIKACFVQTDVYYYSKSSDYKFLAEYFNRCYPEFC